MYQVQRKFPLIGFSGFSRELKCAILHLLSGYPSLLILCMPILSCMPCLGACIVIFPEAEQVPKLRDLGITGPSGEHLPYWDL